MDEAELTAFSRNIGNHMRRLGDMRTRMADITASRSAADERVTVTVDATGVVVDIEFSSDIDELAYDEIAEAVTAAAKAAVAEAKRMVEALVAPLRAERAELPSLSDIVAGLPDLRTLNPEPGQVSTAPPGARDRTTQVPQTEFTVEGFDHDRRSGTGATESSW